MERATRGHRGGHFHHLGENLDARWQRGVGDDYTDPDFLAHMRGVYANLKAGGIKGLMFDYPESGRAKAGGMEDDHSTMAAAYRRISQLAHDGLGNEAYVDERNMEFGSDVTLGVVDSMRTENDTDGFDSATVTRCGLRWYKNRLLVSHDTDSKNLARLQGNRDHVRAVLTMAYVVSGRLLLANSFNQMWIGLGVAVAETRVEPEQSGYRSPEDGLYQQAHRISAKMKHRRPDCVIDLLAYMPVASILTGPSRPDETSGDLAW